MDDETRTLAARAINRTWDMIASDAMPDDGEPLSQRDREDIQVEVTLDADRLEMYGDQPEAVVELRKLPFEEQCAFARKTFGMKPRRGDK
jgi:hypothetical protein